MLKAKLIKRGISKLGLIATVNGSQAVGMLIVQPQDFTRILGRDFF
jgi:hypothetical protein